MNAALEQPSDFRQTSRLVAAHPFLRGLSSDHLQVLLDAAMPKEFAAGELIFKKGDPANRFYLIESGKVLLESPEEEGDPTLIQIIGAGEVLGWSWLFPPFYWNFNARAAELTKAIFFYGSRLNEQCERDHDLGYELTQRMAEIIMERLQWTRRKLVESLRSRA